MSWENIMKVMSGRQFMEELQETLGGELKGGLTGISRGEKGEHRELHYDGGYIKLDVQKGGTYKINVNGKVFGSIYNLKTAKSTVLRHLKESKIVKAEDMAKELVTILKKWREKQYPSDEARWRDYYNDIATLVSTRRKEFQSKPSGPFTDRE